LRLPNAPARSIRYQCQSGNLPGAFKFAANGEWWIDLVIYDGAVDDQINGKSKSVMPDSVEDASNNELIDRIAAKFI